MSDRAWLEVHDVQAALHAHHPDVVVVDSRCRGASAAVASTRMVWAQVATTYREDARLIQATLDALADEPVSVVATSLSRDPARFRAPGNASVHAFVPHRVILDRAVVAICHGGLDVTQKALLARVPVCVVPFDRDQMEVARRVVAADAGVCLPASRLHPSRLRLAVNAAMTHRQGTIQAAETLNAAGGAPAAATALERLLSVQQPTP